ncbi:MAG: hypothetical protein ACLR76_08030 [Alistipes sp.]
MQLINKDHGHVAGEKVGFYTLGCKMNFSETSTIEREFEAGGFCRARRGSLPTSMS